MRKKTTSQPEKSSWAVVGFFQNDSGFLREWILFYLSQGASHIYLVDNHSTDTSREDLRSFLEKGLISIYDPAPHLGFKDQVVEAYNRLGNIAATSCEYALFLDTDEFLIFNQGAPLSDHWMNSPPQNGYVYNWCLFGTSDVKSLASDEWMIEKLTRRFGNNHNEHLHVKSLVRITQPFAFYKGNPHYPELAWGHKMQWPDGSPFDTNQRKIDFSFAKIHHYWYRTEEFYQKVKKPRRVAFDGGRSEEDEKNHKLQSHELEDTSAALYIKALKLWAKNHKL